MVTATVSGGVITLNSTRELTEEQVKKIAQNAKKVEHVCKDLHINHLVQPDKMLSIVGRSYDSAFDVIREGEHLEKKHQELIDYIDNLGTNTVEVNTTTSQEDSDAEDLAVLRFVIYGKLYL